MTAYIPFGDVRKKVFALISRDDMHLVSEFFDKNKIDVIEYQWQYIDSNHPQIQIISATLGHVNGGTVSYR